MSANKQGEQDDNDGSDDPSHGSDDEGDVASESKGPEKELQTTETNDVPRRYPGTNPYQPHLPGATAGYYFMPPPYYPSGSMPPPMPYGHYPMSPPEHFRSVSHPIERQNKGGVTEPFPDKLHRMLETCERDGHTDVVSFFSHGRAFAIHKPRRFVNEIMPRFFRQTKLTSFQRQLNLYGFRRISQGPDNGGYYHELFLKGRPELCANMKRVKVKGDAKLRRDPESEPNFYAFPPINSVGLLGPPRTPPGMMYPPHYGYLYVPYGNTPPPPYPMQGYLSSPSDMQKSHHSLPQPPPPHGYGYPPPLNYGVPPFSPYAATLPLEPPGQPLPSSIDRKEKNQQKKGVEEEGDDDKQIDKETSDDDSEANESS